VSSGLSYLVEWEDRYSVGVPPIDRQHRVLVSMIRQLQEAMASGSTRELLVPVAHKLMTYTVYHFQWEEQFYRREGFSRIEAHSGLHKHMADQVIRMAAAAHEGRLKAGRPILVFLQHWLIDHILGEDKGAFAECAENRTKRESQASRAMDSGAT